MYTRSADDHWTFLGRNSDMIKAGGIWVSPAEVESVLVSHPDILEAAVVGSRNAHGLEEVVAFVVARSGRHVDADVVDCVLPRPDGIVQTTTPALWSTRSPTRPARSSEAAAQRACSET